MWSQLSHGAITVLGFIITLLIVGLIAGFLARAILPGDDSMGTGGTILLGNRRLVRRRLPGLADLRRRPGQRRRAARRV